MIQIARSRGVDVITGEGLDDALNGVECIVDVATQPSPDETTARRTDVRAVARRKRLSTPPRAGSCGGRAAVGSALQPQGSKDRVAATLRGGQPGRHRVCARSRARAS